jgi:hypothetical protein
VIPMVLGENGRFVWVTLDLPFSIILKVIFSIQYVPLYKTRNFNLPFGNNQQASCLGKGQAGSTVFAIDFTAKISTAKLLPLT